MAVLSSQIEGTQCTLADLLEYESNVAPGTPVGDVAGVSRYVEALRHGMDAIRTGRLPLSLRLIREIHGVLMREGRDCAACACARRYVEAGGRMRVPAGLRGNKSRGGAGARGPRT